MTQTRLDGRRVLILEEEGFLSGYIASVLEDCGAQIVGPFTDPEQSRSEWESGTPSAAVLDIHAKGALELAGSMYAAGVPLVFVTTRPAASVPMQYASVPFFTRPFAAHQIASALSDLFASPSGA